MNDYRYKGLVNALLKENGSRVTLLLHLVTKGSSRDRKAGSSRDGSLASALFKTGGNELLFTLLLPLHIATGARSATV